MTAVQSRSARRAFSGTVIATNRGNAHVKNKHVKQVVSVYDPKLRAGDLIHATGDMSPQRMSLAACDMYAIDRAECSEWMHFVASHMSITHCRPAPETVGFLDEAAPSASPAAADLAVGVVVRNPRTKTKYRLTGRTVKGGRPAWKVECIYIMGCTIVNGYERT